MKTWILIPAVALLCCATQKTPEEVKAPAAAPALKGGDLREKVEALLGGYERVPTEADFKALGPGALSVLEQIYNDPSQLPTRRTRAVASMALVDNPEAEAKLRGILGDAKAETEDRATAATALAYRAKGKAVPDLVPLLEGKEVRLREAAARALGQTGTSEARKSLEERLGREDNAAVREAIQQTLTKMEP